MRHFGDPPKGGGCPRQTYRPTRRSPSSRDRVGWNPGKTLDPPSRDIGPALPGKSQAGLTLPTCVVAHTVGNRSNNCLGPKQKENT